MGTVITKESKENFKSWLYNEERSEGTVAKYMRDIERLSEWLDGRGITKESLIKWKEHLIDTGYKPETINSMIAVANTYCRFADLNIKVKFLRIQKKMFRDKNKELTKDEYRKLIRSAEEKGNTRLALLIETIGATGIRVSEVQYITVETVKMMHTQVFLKGKIRDIFLPEILCRKLLKYATTQKIASGEIFITRSGRGMSREQIWTEMKVICKVAEIEPCKVFPHNLRHLFARTFYQSTHDVANLADLLGHSSIETTRIYLLSTGTEHRQQLEALGLVQ